MSQSNRRTFLKASSLTLGSLGFGLPNLYGATDNKGHKKSVIFIFLAGGLSGAESFNVYEPESVIEKNRAVNGVIKTKSGFLLGADWSELSTNSELFTLVHSFGHQNAGHQGGSVQVNTGHIFTDENQGAKLTYPSYGSIISKHYGTNNQKTGVPNYVATSKNVWNDSAFLGNSYNPFAIDNEGKKSLGLNIDADRFVQRFNTLQSLDNKFKELKNLNIQDDYKKQAYDVVFGEASSVFNIDKEPVSIRDKYGKTDIGNNCLLARRLVENGVRYVTISSGGWDFHSSISQGMKNLVPPVDKAISFLLTDLKERGLLDSTLVVVSTEFSRTYINKDNGRDHWPQVTPLLLAGGKYGGTTIGTMDKNAYTQKDTPYYPINLLSTIMTFMDIPLNIQYTDFSGRPRFIVDGQDRRIIT